MALVMRMPKMSDTMQKGKISSWLKKIGDNVKSGTVIAEIETDKATMELEAEEDGVLLYLGAKEKDSLDINSILVIIGNDGEDINHLLSNDNNIIQDNKNNSVHIKTDIQPQTHITTTPTLNINRITASPLAKSIAKEENINLSSLTGSGENGRIIKRDLIKNFSNTFSTKNLESKFITELYEDIPLSSIRSIIAKKLTESKKTAPHFYLNMSINMDKIVDIRPDINEFYKTKISFNDIIIKATAIALRKHIKLNASWHETFIRQYEHINIGIAVAIDDSLVVPVLRYTDSKSLLQISVETKNLQEKAITKKLKPTDMQGSTFTISNLGMYGIESFSAIINPPEACILAVGAIEKIPAIQKNEIIMSHVMKVTLSCDHRTVDGAIGAAFLQEFKHLLEHPHLLLL